MSEEKITITLDDLESKGTPKKWGSVGPSSGGTPPPSRGQPPPPPSGTDAGGGPTFYRKGWFYLAAAGVLGAVLGWGVTEPTYVDGAGADKAESGGVLDEFAKRLEEAGAQTGDIQLSLMWRDYNDLDLHCIDPLGDHIYFDKRYGRRGTLDVDKNAKKTELTNQPVENIFFSNPAKGRYKVYVHHFDTHGKSTNEPFTLRIKKGEESRDHKSTAIYKGGTASIEDVKRKAWSFGFNYQGPQSDEEAELEEGFGNFAMLPLVLALVCLGFGVAESAVERSLPKALAKGGLALLFGLAFGFAAQHLAEATYAFGDKILRIRDPEAWDAMLLRGASWIVFGLGAGLVYGLVGKSLKQGLYGCAGGALGAFAGGLLFNPIVAYAGDPELSRALGFSFLGCATGLSIGLVESALKDRWLYVSSGPLAGKQFILYKEETTLGSHPKSDLYLFKDPAVQSRHAVLRIRKNQTLLESEGETLINGASVTSATLHSGDVIEVGRYSFQFEEKLAK